MSNLNKAKELRDNFEYGWNYEEINPITKEAHENNCKQEAKQLKEKVEKGCGIEMTVNYAVVNKGRPFIDDHSGDIPGHVTQEVYRNCGDIIPRVHPSQKGFDKNKTKLLLHEDCQEILKLLNEILGEKE